MKVITLRQDGNLKSKDVFTQIIRVAPKGMDIAEMRSRIRVLDKLEAAEDSLELEDADYNVLQTAIQGNQWGVADKGLLQIIDDVLSPGT